MNYTQVYPEQSRRAKRSTLLRIGIIGGGQLGRMLTIAAKKLGFFVTVTDPTPNSPAGLIADKQIIGDYKDKKTTYELAKESDVITIDAEFVNVDVLKDLEKKGAKIYPKPQIIEIIKDKLKQKEFFSSNNIKTAEFVSVSSASDIQKASEKFGYPLILKARFDAYDGKGNFVVKNIGDIEKGLEKLQGRFLYVEKFVPFVKELAVMVARSTSDGIAVYPIVETVHANNICDTVIAPARISERAKNNARDLAIHVMNYIQGAGVFGIEMFLEISDNVLVNEIAPRVHNSGHYTIEATETSQFEQHIRAITGLTLGKTNLKVKASVMKNILGEKNGPGIPEGLEKAEKIPGISVHIYGKYESRIGRKMGHITVVGETTEECLKKANKARKAIVI